VPGVEFRGGGKMTDALNRLSAALGRRIEVRVGFLEGATYEDGTPVAMVAAIHEFGAPRANVPRRPFFSQMIERRSPGWPEAIAGNLRKFRFDGRKAMHAVGEGVAGQLRQEINEFVGVPLKEATIRRKGFDKQLIDKSTMVDSVDLEIAE